MLEEAVLQIKMYPVISRFPILDASNSLNIDPLDSTNQNFQFQNHYCNDLCFWPRGDPLTSPWPCSYSVVTSQWPCRDPSVTRLWHHSRTKNPSSKASACPGGTTPILIHTVQSGRPLIILKAGVFNDRADFDRSPLPQRVSSTAGWNGLPQSVTPAPGLACELMASSCLWSHSDESSDHALASGAGMEVARCPIDGHTGTRAVYAPVIVRLWVDQ